MIEYEIIGFKIVSENSAETFNHKCDPLITDGYEPYDCLVMTVSNDGSNESVYTQQFIKYKTETP